MEEKSKMSFSSDSQKESKEELQVPPETEGIDVKKAQLAQEHNIPVESVEIRKVPVDIIYLPSQGLLYPETSSLFNKDRIEVKQMTAAEEDILSSRYLLRTGKAIDMLIANCLMDKSFNPGDLLTGDKNSIMIGLRIGAYGAEYKVDMECAECGEVSKGFTFDLTKLAVKEIDRSLITPGYNSLTCNLSSGTTICFKFLSSNEEKEITDANNSFKKHIGSKVDKLISLKHEKQIISVDGNDNKGYVASYIRNMPARDSRELNKYIEKVMPDVSMEINFECPACGYIGEEVMPITEQFFWPD